MTVPGPTCANGHLCKLLDAEGNHSVTDLICSLLTIRDIISLTRTCKGLSHLYQAILPSQWNIDRALEPFCKDPWGLRVEMAKCGAIIEGAFAVSFFERRRLEGIGLDIIVEDRGGKPAIGVYFEREEGYLETIPRRGDRGKDDLDLLGDWLYHSYKTPGGARCRIFACVHPPVQAVMKAAKSTLMVNIITHDRAISLFPRSTFIDHRYFRFEQFDTPGPREQKVWERWAIQGWYEDEKGLMPCFGLLDDPKKRTRFIGDHHSWVIPLSPLPERVIGSTSSSMALLENYVFQIDGFHLPLGDTLPTIPRNGYYYTMSLSTIIATTLRHAYTAPHVRSSPPWSWVRFLRSKIYQSALRDFEEMPLEEQDGEARMSLNWLRDGSLDTFFSRKPSRWRFVDEQVHGWYLEWLQRPERDWTGAMRRPYQVQEQRSNFEEARNEAGEKVKAAARRLEMEIEACIWRGPR